METTVINGMCRCCGSEGAFKDIKRSYHWMGEEEVYGEMLKDCFDVDLGSTEDSEGGICEVCITQLRNAFNFKKQVLLTEEQFKKQLQMKFFKPTVVKVELQDENNQSDDNISIDDGFSGPELEVPIKKEGAEEAKPKKRAATAKASTSRAKRSKAIEDPEDTITTKRNDCGLASVKIKKIHTLLKAPTEANEPCITNGKLDDWPVSISKKPDNVNARRITLVRSQSKLDEIKKHLHNARTILVNSNATPMRCYNSVGYKCGFCYIKYPDPRVLKTHTLEQHDSSLIKDFMKGQPMDSYVVKLDITGLRCRICNNTIFDLDGFIEHLETEHAVLLYKDVKSHILPFRYEDNAFVCGVCSENYFRFKVLQEHMRTHFRNYVCDTCSAGFVNSQTYRAHIVRHDVGEFECKFCRKVFDTHVKRTYHEKFVHIQGQERNKCPHCPQKFTSFYKRNKHMEDKHDVRPIVFKCKVCDLMCGNRAALTRHMNAYHMLERRHDCDMKSNGHHDLCSGPGSPR